MARFIMIHEKGEERLVNLNWIEEVRPDDDGQGVVYFAFQGHGCMEQDCIKTDETFGELVLKIWE